MNFKKLMIGVAVIVVAIVVFKMVSSTDRSDPVKVANAFTKAMKTGDTETAAGYFVPDAAEAWKTATSDRVGALRRQTKVDFYERIPSDPGFTMSADAKGNTIALSSDKSVTLNMQQVEGKWYVSKSSI